MCCSPQLAQAEQRLAERATQPSSLTAWVPEQVRACTPCANAGAAAISGAVPNGGTLIRGKHHERAAQQLQLAAAVAERLALESLTGMVLLFDQQCMSASLRSCLSSFARCTACPPTSRPLPAQGYSYKQRSGTPTELCFMGPVSAGSACCARGSRCPHAEQAHVAAEQHQTRGNPPIPTGLHCMRLPSQTDLT